MIRTSAPIRNVAVNGPGAPRGGLGAEGGASMTTSYGGRAQADEQADVRRASAQYGADRGTAHQGAAFGLTILAAVLMILAGLWDLTTGIAAVVKGGFFVVTHNYTHHYLYNISITGWGWIQIGLGAVLLAVGLCLLASMTWARIAGIFIVAISAVMNFLYIPRYPLWGILLVALDVLVIWALANVRRPADY
jgi:hypothetical protein